MKMLKIQGISLPIIIEPGKIVNIEIESCDIYKKMLFGLFYEEDIIIYSEDYDIKDTFKSGLMIFDITQVNPNEKKIISALHSKTARFLNSDEKLQLNSINYQFVQILENLSFYYDCPITFNTDLDIIKILGLYNFSYDIEDKFDFLKLLTFYLKAKMEVTPYKFILVFDILKFFSTDELKLLKKELEILNVTLVNFKNTSTNDFEKIETIIIDKDLCEVL